MQTDKVSALLQEARSLFGATPVSEMIGLDKETATEILNEKYNEPDADAIDRYLDVVEQLRW